MTHQELKTLYERCSSGNSTPEEQRLFEEYKDNFDISDIPWTHEMGDYDKVRKILENDLYRRWNKRKNNVRKLWYLSAAASVLIGLGILFFSSRAFIRPPVPQLATKVKPVIQPGGNKAILTLGDGSQILLDDTKKGQISTQHHTTVLKDKNGQLVYQNNATKDPEFSEIYNMVATPRGGQYGLVLSDGTKVWLNAESRLKYPVNFNGKDRVVQLTGEAYFEVAKNKLKPFRVVTNEKTVEVLGTHFNINAYPNEAYQTTLLEGSVKLNSGTGASAMLTPGEQATLNTKQAFNITKVNASDAIAWKNGIFLFKNENIQSVMRKISRWYDVQIEYRGDVNNKKLGGSVSRFEDIGELLHTIQLTESVHFKIDGRRVIVMP